MRIGWMELLVIAVVALIVIGPDKFPSYAKKFGKALKDIKKVSSELTEEIQKEVVEPLNEAVKPLKDAVEPINEAAKELKKTTNDLKKSVTSIGKDDTKKTAKVEEKADEKIIEAEVVKEETVETVQEG